MITHRITSIYIDKEGSEFNRKYRGTASTTITVEATEGNICYPLMYIKKPKGVSLEDWNVIKQKLTLILEK